MNARLENKIALVTGGSRGIGAAIAKRLAEDGATVAINYARSADAAERVVKDMQSNGGRAQAFQADVGNQSDIERMFREIDDTFGGRLDILVNNAGVFAMKPIHECDVNDFDHMMNINVRAVFLITRLAVQRLADNGRIVTIGSVNADRMPGPGGALYSMSKAAVQGLTRGWARDLGPRGITVNCVQPGPIDTDMNPADGAFAEFLRQMTAIERYGRAEEVAELVAMLASPGGANITGAMLDVDGGFKA